MESETARSPCHVWPWFVLAALILGVVLAVLGVRGEARRLKEYRQFEATPAATNAPPTPLERSGTE